MIFKIIIPPTALKMLKEIPDRRIQTKIGQVIDGLAHDPELKGKALWDELSGFRSIRAVGQRYRIVYKVDRGIVTVFVVAVGLRKEGDRSDVYRLAQKLIRLRLA